MRTKRYAEDSHLVTVKRGRAEVCQRESHKRFRADAAKEVAESLGYEMVTPGMVEPDQSIRFRAFKDGGQEWVTVWVTR